MGRRFDPCRGRQPARRAALVGLASANSVGFSTIFDAAERAASVVPAVSRDSADQGESIPRDRGTSQPRDPVPAYIDRRLALSSGRNSLLSGRGDTLRSVSP